MKRILTLLLLLGLGMLGCNAAKPTGSTAPASSTSIMAGAWVTTISNFIGGRTDIVTAVNLVPNGTPIYAVGTTVANVSCANGGITYTPGHGPQPPGNAVVGPACFVAFAEGFLSPSLTSSSNGFGSGSGVLAMTFSIGVPTNPVQNGSTFNIQYAEFDSSYGIWQMDGTGTVNNGTASGTWVCDQSTSACSGMSGTFTASQQ